MEINENFMEQFVNPFVTDKLANIYKNDEEYQKRQKEEDSIYQKLVDELPFEQTQQLEEYFIALSSAAARRETLSYIQGMKDLLALLKYLSK